MELALFPESRSISRKELVVKILSEEWPLSIRQIHERMKRMYAVDCSYQAVFKHVKELGTKGIIESDGRQYSLSLEWMERLYVFIQNHLECCEENPEGIIGPRRWQDMAPLDKSKKPGLLQALNS